MGRKKKNIYTHTHTHIAKIFIIWLNPESLFSVSPMILCFLPNIFSFVLLLSGSLENFLHRHVSMYLICKENLLLFFFNRGNYLEGISKTVVAVKAGGFWKYEVPEIKKQRKDRVKKEPGHSLYYAFFISCSEYCK